MISSWESEVFVTGLVLALRHSQVYSIRFLHAGIELFICSIL
ncbi:hypothetical protein VCRA2114E365_60066 [Vibrio crassostreae]|nr:hypothetical protein VCRA2117O378_150006 [Vibrio crassostreae]CAK2039215.1 hypothetical protein VCRA2119O381_30092 [Vibrio crassostreae]CAK2168887.1 hypothetical protein VCRA2113O357_60066 [Vibrio crassostreae]CAK2169497.1 hypothetical protein VCRA2117O376_60067 [Vibrio crassostreae]CAK2174456.1 hypothetical protein VCRA2113O351_60066 [Vibrio crassostreae]